MGAVQRPIDPLELVEYQRSPGLRRRVHPKRDQVAVAFAAPPPRAASLEPEPPLSDLDVHVTHSPRDREDVAPSTPSPLPARPANRLIYDTVDSWARRARTRDHYRPLVFGGTYPIDVPTAVLDGEAHKRELRRTIEQSLDKFEAILARRDADMRVRKRITANRTAHTYDIDEPMGAGDPPPDTARNERDTKYYVSGPKTFNIDEPVSFI